MYIVLKVILPKKEVSIHLLSFPTPQTQPTFMSFYVISLSISIVSNKLLMIFLDLLISNIYF